MSKTTQKGFKAFRKLYQEDNRKLNQIRNCNSCKFLNLDLDTNEEACTNSGVTSYDMVESDNVKYCSFWIPSWKKD